MKTQVRVRFAPSPSGMMHLGNVRAALLNYLFAQKHNGTFVLRIEDTDAERNFDHRAAQIIHDLLWLGLEFDEGADKGGPFGPYFQSERTNIYKEKLSELEKKDAIYRCFCTPEELEKRRQRQIALKMPPRYDRTCLNLSQEAIATNLKEHKPFIWRLKIPQEKTISIHDIAHGTITFNLKEVSDTPLTRTDGSFTFIFANCVDDILMQITHVIRGEDHLTNTASQIVLYESFNATIPVFWHLPIICNNQGKKLSKRDFGFSLNDLINAGYLPEAICNYLGIIGGSFEQEIMSRAQLAQAIDFENLNSSSQIRYDVEKLKWINHKWISAYDNKELVSRCLPFLIKEFPQAEHIGDELALKLIAMVKTDLTTVADVSKALGFYFAPPSISLTDLSFLTDSVGNKILFMLNQNINLIEQPDQFIEKLKSGARQENISPKDLWHTMRVILTGSTQGMGIKELIDLLGIEESQARIKRTLSNIRIW